MALYHVAVDTETQWLGSRDEHLNMVIHRDIFKIVQKMITFNKEIYYFPGFVPSWDIAIHIWLLFLRSSQSDGNDRCR